MGVFEKFYFFVVKICSLQSCALALYQTAPLMTADIANSVLTRELQNGKQPANYANFIKDFAMILVGKSKIVIFILRVFETYLCF